jgi:hypothetical protein
MLGRAKTEQRKDAGSVRRLAYERDRGRRDATVCSRPSVARTFGGGRTNAV